jgi:hypothetical protein
MCLRSAPEKYRGDIHIPLLHICAACPARLILLDLIILIMQFSIHSRHFIILRSKHSLSFLF